MPLTKSTLLSSGPIGNPDQIGYTTTGNYTGSGSTVLLPTTTGRFSDTIDHSYGDRLVSFYRILVPKPATFSGVSITFSANNATSKTISAITESSGTATATCTAHGFSAGDRIRISGATPTAYNNTFLILSVTTNTFTFSIQSGTGSASGTILARQFVGAAVYDYDKTTLLPKNKLVDCAIIPTTSNTSASFDANTILAAGMYWIGIGPSKKTGNATFATIVCCDNQSTSINTHLFGIKSSDMSQYRGGVGIAAYDNADTSNGNSGFPLSLNAGGPYIAGTVSIYSDASAGNSWFGRVGMVGLIVV